MFGKWIYIWLAFAVKVKEEALRWGYPSKYIWVDIAPKREKNAEKWHFQFEDVTFCYLYLAKERYSLPHCFLPKVAPPICASTVHLCCPYLWARLRTRASRTDVCTYARVPTAMLFFCCHKCHIKGEIDAKTVVFLGGDDKIKPHFFKFCPPNLRDLNERFVKICPCMM